MTDSAEPPAFSPIDEDADLRVLYHCLALVGEPDAHLATGPNETWSLWGATAAASPSPSPLSASELLAALLPPGADSTKLAPVLDDYLARGARTFRGDDVQLVTVDGYTAQVGLCVGVAMGAEMLLLQYETSVS